MERNYVTVALCIHRDQLMSSTDVASHGPSELLTKLSVLPCHAMYSSYGMQLWTKLKIIARMSE